MEKKETEKAEGSREDWGRIKQDKNVQNVKEEKVKL